MGSPTIQFFVLQAKPKTLNGPKCYNTRILHMNQKKSKIALYI